MRIVMTYGLEPITDAVENKLCLDKAVKNSARRLLKEMVDCSNNEEFQSNMSSSLEKRTSTADPSNDQRSIKVPMKQGDWHCLK